MLKHLSFKQKKKNYQIKILKNNFNLFRPSADVLQEGQTNKEVTEPDLAPNEYASLIFG